MRIPARFSLALLLAAFPLHAQETPDPIEFSQEEYNQKVAREMEEMNQALQAMSKFMVKSMNNMTEAINKSAPGIAKSMGELVKSMEPIIKAAQQNQDFAAQTPETTEPQPDAAANDVTRQFQELPMSEIIGGPLQAAAEAQTRQAETAADFINQLQIKQQATPEKPAKPQINQIYRPKRIQLFPAPQPNHD